MELHGTALEYGFIHQIVALQREVDLAKQGYHLEFGRLIDDKTEGSAGRMLAYVDD
jgi:hypothetical protein